MDAGAYLDARDARDALVAEVVRRARGRGSQAVVWMTANVPGPDKRPPGLDDVFNRAREAAERHLPGANLAVEGGDFLGPYAALFVCGDPAGVKRAAVALEEEVGERRLIDIDVYDEQGLPWDRARLGLPQRTCLVCDEPARECIRLQRHTPHELATAVTALVAPTLSADALARRLVAGARIELDVTPKPGLVDQHDNGSHPDLSHALMTQSIALLPAYFDELLALRRAGAGLALCIDAGCRAERRMFDAIGANAHRGYIFLSGLLLLAACDVEGGPPHADASPAPDPALGEGGIAGRNLVGLRTRLRALAREFFDRTPAPNRPASSHAAPVRGRRGVDGIRAEALAGLPSVFDQGLPAYQNALRRSGTFMLASYTLLGVLMRSVEDTTAIHRCGPGGLVRLRQDGAALSQLVASGANPLPFLEALNDEYRRLRLTMGGVADCMAVVYAFHPHGAPPSPASAL